jgi:hypothetical protein
MKAFGRDGQSHGFGPRLWIIQIKLNYGLIQTIFSWYRCRYQCRPTMDSRTPYTRTVVSATSGRVRAGSSSNSTGTGGISIGRAGAFILSLTIRGSLRPSSHTAGARGRASHTRTGLDFSFVWDNLANLLPGLWIIQIKLNYGLIWILDCPSLDCASQHGTSSTDLSTRIDYTEYACHML